MVTWADGGEVEEMVTPPSLDSLLFFWGKTFRKPAKAVEHEVEPSRLALFCDAYVGVVATLLYLPLMSLLEDEGEPEVDLESKGNVGLFTMKWLRAWTSFLMILVVYIAHSNVLYFLKGYDITILVLTLLSLLAIGLIPFTVSLSQLGSEIGEVYPTEIDLSVFLFLAVMIFCIWIQAWRKRDHLMWKKISYPEWRYLAFRIGCFILAILITIGLTFLFYFPQLGILLIQYLLIRIFCFFFPILDHLKEKKENENESTEPTETEPILQEEDKKTKRKKHFRKKLDHFGRAAGGMVHRERYIILTDAIYAFSATLIVADLQLSDFETSEVLHSKQLWAILSDKLPEIVGYLWCFVALAVFWTLHDRCFSCIFKVTSGVVLSASLGLSVVPTMAFGCKSSMISVFGEAPFPSVALMFVNGTQTIISLSYFFMYVVVSTRPDIIKPSHYHIFAHSTSKTRFWHLEIQQVAVSIDEVRNQTVALQRELIALQKRVIPGSSTHLSSFLSTDEIDDLENRCLGLQDVFTMHLSLLDEIESESDEITALRKHQLIRIVDNYKVLEKMIQGLAEIRILLKEEKEIGKSQFSIYEPEEREDEEREKGGGKVHFACRSGSLEEVKELVLSDPSSVHLEDREGMTPLGVATQEGHIELVKFLLQKGAAVHVSSESGATPLHFAVQIGNQEIVENLLNSGADPNRQDNVGTTPLFVAAIKANRDTSILQHLLSKGAEVNFQRKNGATALSGAALKGDAVVCEFLLANGAEVDLKKKNQKTPLHIATKQGEVEVSKVLLSHGADPTAKDREGWSPLHFAVKSGKKELVELLLAHKAQPDLPENNQWTPLHLATASGFAEICSLLLKQTPGAINLKEEDGWCALHLAAQNGHVKTIEVLLDPQFKVEINTFAKTVASPLHVTALHPTENQVAIGELLLSAGADVNIQDHNGVSPLHVAAMKGLDDFVKLLLQKGKADADLQEKELNESSALHLAAECGHIEVMKLLLQYGADPKLLDKYGRDPKEILSQVGFEELVPIYEEKVKQHTATPLPSRVGSRGRGRPRREMRGAQFLKERGVSLRGRGRGRGNRGPLPRPALRRGSLPTPPPLAALALLKKEEKEDAPKEEEEEDPLETLRNVLASLSIHPESLFLSTYNLLVEEGIDLPQLESGEIGEDDLEKLGFKMGIRKKLLRLRK